MKQDIRDYLTDIIDAINEIEAFLKGIKDFASFKNNKEKVYSTMYLLARIGEAVKKIPNPTKTKYSHIPWRDIAGMRDILLHEYFRTDLQRVWETVHRDLSPLKEAIEKILIDMQQV
ncbi:MAG: hypothetical protein A2Y62_20410 [Candidatus Fischerbacteria bacterium RBG_13_37_8]|uniref:DUF86 domain-containing protein n=1 Tax=Candidatus Fischerbacteria bacterium RBG_13_37_8 TaxID=1817863 RepID=A0A1F5VX13_9BACT|nr:MAG: hypothetical protein A2Y62_20410 [Candidatus Fischerbacteria bacterium RBG_13_37_8]